MDWRTLAAQVGVSMLRKMLSTTRWPVRSLRLIGDRSPFTTVKAGSGFPVAGRSPAVWTGLRPTLVSAIGLVLLVDFVING